MKKRIAIAGIAVAALGLAGIIDVVIHKRHLAAEIVPATLPAERSIPAAVAVEPDIMNGRAEPGAKPLEPTPVPRARPIENKRSKLHRKAHHHSRHAEATPAPAPHLYPLCGVFKVGCVAY